MLLKNTRPAASRAGRALSPLPSLADEREPFQPLAGEAAHRERLYREHRGRRVTPPAASGT